MTYLTRVMVTVWLLPLSFSSLSAAVLPKDFASTASTKPPQIDGVINSDEWRSAAHYQIDLKFLRASPALSESRPCQLWVMNSANALYVAFQVPDETVDDSISPIKLDASSLAFGSTSDATIGTDRKVIAKGFYRDKHASNGGKQDLDDARQDGLGAMQRKDGKSNFEWGVPLNSVDAQDLKFGPGESVKINIVYFDALQLPFTQTTMGGVFGAVLDSTSDWGTLTLAANVTSDDGSAFKGPVWLQDVKHALNQLAPSNMRVVGEKSLQNLQVGAAMFKVAFSYLDPVGKSVEAKAKFYFPASFNLSSKRKYPLYFVAGYEAPDGGAVGFLNRDCIVVSPSELPANPLIRLVNPDVCLLHLARKLHWIDDTRVMIGGGSAGGWMTLMLSAETFPLAGSMPDVPPVNWGYNAAYFFKQLQIIEKRTGESTSRVPALLTVATMLKPSVDVQGGDFNDETWFASSPVAHVSTITCPVNAYWTTADVLVPIDQVGSGWVQKIDSHLFPEGFTTSPEVLMKSSLGRTTLMDVLSKEDYEIFSLKVPQGTRRQNGPEGSGKVEVRDLLVSQNKRWSITIIDEGAPLPDVDHRKYALITTREKFLDHITTAPIEVRQLSEPKLRRMLKRYMGKEWLPSRLKHLDRLESERNDVVRGLRTFLSMGPVYVERFKELYFTLSAEEQVLDRALVESLTLQQ